MLAVRPADAATTHSNDKPGSSTEASLNPTAGICPTICPTAAMTSIGKPVASATSSPGETTIAFKNRFKLHSAITIAATPKIHLQASSAAKAPGALTSARNPSAVGDGFDFMPTA